MEGENDNVLLVTVTERRTKDELDPLRQCLEGRSSVVIYGCFREDEAASAPLDGSRDSSPRCLRCRSQGALAYQLRTTGVPALSPWMRWCPSRTSTTRWWE